MIVLIADTHVRSDPKENQILQDHLEALEAQFPACWLVIAGDVTDNGTEAEYKEAYRLLASWKNRCLLVPGNHDNSGYHGLRWDAKAAARWTKFSTKMSNSSDTVTGDWVICGLDSVNAHPDILELAQGELGEAELNRAKDVIQQAHNAGKKICLVLHHQPSDSPRSGTSKPLTATEDQFLNWAEKLKDSSEFLSIAYGGETGADKIIAGHLHTHLEWTATQGIPTHLISLGDLRGSGDFVTLP